MSLRHKVIGIIVVGLPAIGLLVYLTVYVWPGGSTSSINQESNADESNVRIEEGHPDHARSGDFVEDQEFFKQMERDVADGLSDVADAYAKQRDPAIFIRRSGHEIDPAIARKLLKQDALPVLYEMLSDSEKKEQWPNIAKTICCLSDSPGQSAPIVIDYIRRQDEWEPGTSENHYGTLGKVHTLQWLGMLDTELAHQTLIDALSQGGAEELAKSWIDAPLPKWAKTEQEDIIGVIQGMAAVGTVYSRNEQGVGQVHQDFAQAVQDRAEMEFTPYYFILLIEAMSIDSVISDIGFDAYKRMLNEPGLEERIQKHKDLYFSQMHQ